MVSNHHDILKDNIGFLSYWNTLSFIIDLALNSFAIWLQTILFANDLNISCSLGSFINRSSCQVFHFTAVSQLLQTSGAVLTRIWLPPKVKLYEGHKQHLLHRGRNKICSFRCLLGCPQRPQGCQKIRHYPLNLDLKVWCSNIQPKLKKLKTKNQSFLMASRGFLMFIQFRLNNRAPNL